MFDWIRYALKDEKKLDKFGSFILIPFIIVMIILIIPYMIFASPLVFIIGGLVLVYCSRSLYFSKLSSRDRVVEEIYAHIIDRSLLTVEEESGLTYEVKYGERRGCYYNEYEVQMTIKSYEDLKTFIAKVRKIEWERFCKEA